MQGAGSRSRWPRRRSRRRSVAARGAAEALDHGVAVAPQHALRASPSSRRCRGCRGRRGCGRRPAAAGRRRRARRRTTRRPGSKRVARGVGHLDDDARGRAASGSTSASVGAKQDVDDDRLRPGVVEQVAQLVGDVAVVDVERRDARLPRAEHRLEVLDAVVAGRWRGGPGPTRGRRSVGALGVAAEAAPARWLASRFVRSATSARVSRRSPWTIASASGSSAAMASSTVQTSSSRSMGRERYVGRRRRSRIRAHRSVPRCMTDEHRVRGVHASGLEDGAGVDRRRRGEVGQGGRDRRCSPRSSATTRSGSTTTSTTCPGRPTRRCSSAGRRSPRSASCTTRIRLGQMVGCNGYRNPALLAKITSMVDVVSGGRLDWGIGAGWYENEFRGYGYEFPKPKDRIGMLRETRRDRARACGPSRRRRTRASTTSCHGPTATRSRCRTRTRRCGSAAAASS